MASAIIINRRLMSPTLMDPCFRLLLGSAKDKPALIQAGSIER